MSNRSREYKLSPLAEIDLEEIWYYSFENWSAEQADKYYGDIIDIFTGLASGLYEGRPVDIRKGYLKYPSGSHVIYYREAKSQIEIIRVLHQMMDTNRHL